MDEALDETHTDTWTRISLAALRVLTEIKTTEEKSTREGQETNCENSEADQNAERARRSTVMVANKKLVR